MKRIEYQSGQEIGDYGVMFIEETESYVNKHVKHRRAYFKCPRCGKQFTTNIDSIVRGKTKSCGCYFIETVKKTGYANKGNKSNLIHGYSGKPEYYIWLEMKQRCYNPKNKDYKNYGGRGITVCDHWLNSFENFIQDMGNKLSPQHSIDRINNDGNYEPNNCRWATAKEQANNKRNNISKPI